jgi:hypothetical protein
MPAVSKAQRRAMSIAEHHPEESYYPSMTKMTHKQLHDFASTKEKGLPGHKKGGKKKGRKSGRKRASK